jgi:hypothetical protein
MIRQFFKYGLRHELAVRWPIWDLKKSNKVTAKIDFESADKIIFEVLTKGEPCLIGRLGGTEARFLKEYNKILSLKFGSKFLFKSKPGWHKRSKQMRSLAGFYFSEIDQAKEFCDIYRNAMNETDILGAWGTTFASVEADYIEKIRYFIPKELTAPWIQSYSQNKLLTPWSKGLSGKKVLVVSYFAESIKKQFAIIDEIFPNNECHDFKLSTLKSPFTADMEMPPSKSWREYLLEVEEQMQAMDFDVALVSAGSYSYPLAHLAKKMGRIGIHAGGGLQLFFGIMGKRWEHSEFYAGAINTKWSRPSERENPPNAIKIEGGAYW